MNKLFASVVLNDEGKRKVREVKEWFDILLKSLQTTILSGHVNLPGHHGGREFAVVQTKLEEACFFAVKAVSLDPENQFDPQFQGDKL